ncbi:autotransporter outer membrane beta-barrel domain-containing protein [Morganella morganii]|nr:autotransporter outer membrane beta-barrel domain-containing protein [Morganella morganii]
MLIGDNLNLESSYVPLSISGQNTNTIIGENSVLSATNGSSIVLNGQNNNLSIGDGGVFHATGYGLNLSGANNSVNLGSVQVTGSRAVLMSGENNTLTVASGSILNGIPSVADPDGSVLAIGGINNTITVDNSVLKSNGSQIIRLSGSGANVKNDGNTINLNNLSIINDYDNPTFENDDSVIGILTTNNEQLDSEYEFTLNLNSGTIETTNSNLINTDMQQHQNSSEMSTAKALININDVTMNNSNGLYLILFGTSDLSQNATDLTFNLIRTDASSFSKGILNNDQSVLKLNLDSSKISGDIVNNTGSQGNMQINGNNGSFITGNIYALDDSGNIDTENAYTSVTLDNSSWIHDNNSHIVDLTNGGNVIFNSPDYGHTLTVHGNYTGNNGHILFNGQLEGDDSVTDKLIIAGNTSGTTSVSVNNIGGQGAQTIDGIELISVGGDSAGNFEQLGRIVAGAYEYFLNRGEGENSKNWYLTNQLDEPDGPDVAIIRPEAGGYINNLSMANQLFNTRLHDRLGETQYTDILTGEKKVTSMWLRNVAGHTNAKSADGQLKTGNMWGGDQYCTN